MKLVNSTKSGISCIRCNDVITTLTPRMIDITGHTCVVCYIKHNIKPKTKLGRLASALDRLYKLISE